MIELNSLRKASHRHGSKYRLLGLIGHGQFGRVYCAMHRVTGQLVALKELDQVRFPTHLFLRELRFLVTLHHPNIVTCWACEHHDHRRYLVMDYCEGGTLRDLIDTYGALPPRTAIAIIQDVLAGLGYAHSQGVIHCDIKPENILLHLHPRGWTARLSDFGIARLNQELQQDQGLTGSPAYMAPERFYGQNSLSADLYAVGVLLYEMLTGERPFSGTPGELMTAHLNQSLVMPETVAPPLRPILRKALAKLQAQRFQSAQSMLEALQAALEETPPSPQAATLPPIALPDRPAIVLETQPIAQPITYFSTSPSNPRDLTATDLQGYWHARIESSSTPSAERWLHVEWLKDHPVHYRTLLPTQDRLVGGLIGLSSKHLGILLRCDPASQGNDRTRMIQRVLIFNRRGRQICALNLELAIEQIWAGRGHYDFFATESGDPQSILFIQLKPFRMHRLVLGWIPERVVAASWGYLISDRSGQAIFLDPSGQPISQTSLPTSIHAIAGVDPHHLLIATWEGSTGTLTQWDIAPCLTAEDPDLDSL